MENPAFTYNLISFKLCPYVQRSVITLEEKETPYTIDHIDLSNKPDWFLALSPLGKVPVLRVNEEAVIFESAVISEFIEETAPGPRLHPGDPLRRAHNRSWIEVASELVRAMHRLSTAASEKETRDAVPKVQNLLSRFESVVAGPLFNGTSFSLVDAAIAPALQRLTWLEELDLSLALFDETPGIRAWRDTLLERTSVQRSTVPAIRALYRAYLRDKIGSWLGSRVTDGDEGEG